MPAFAILSTRYLLLRGMHFLKEKLSLFQAIAVFSGVRGSDFSNYHATVFPALALTMGIISFALALQAKVIHYDVIISITIETLWALLVSLLIFSLAIAILNYIR